VCIPVGEVGSFFFLRRRGLLGGFNSFFGIEDVGLIQNVGVGIGMWYVVCGVL
jgi:hypothetical protein